jgi:hypothetical protein
MRYSHQPQACKRLVEARPIQFELPLDRPPGHPDLKTRKALPPEVLAKLFGEVQWCSGLPSAFLEGRWP